MAHLNFITGEDIFESGLPIAHVVNCQGVMGAGFAKQVKDRYYEAFLQYEDVCSFSDDNDRKLLLGKCQQVGNIINLFAQLGYGKYRRYLNYGALYMALSNISEKEFAIPYKMGCGLAGGDWEIVKEILDFSCNDSTIHVYQEI